MATPQAQARVIGDLNGSALTVSAGETKFLVGGPNGFGGAEPGPNPYDLLSASLAACTALTVRMSARHKKIALSHLEIAVCYRRGSAGDTFQRTITLEGDLNDDQRAQLLRAADSCPVGKTLGLSATIYTSINDQELADNDVGISDYGKDLIEFSIVNIDPD